MPIECYREILEQADSDEIRRGRTWYRDARKTIKAMADESGVTIEIAAGVVAVLSPMVEWSLNLVEARHFLRKKGRGPQGAGFTRNYRKAREVLRGNLDVIRGPKVSRFFKTLIDPKFNEAVIDTQMIAAFYRGKAYRDDFRVVFQSEKRLSPIREAIRTIADERGETVGTIQATIWMTFKRLNGPYAMQLKIWD